MLVELIVVRLALVADRLVDVEFVIVPLVELMFVNEIFPADKIVTVALVRVALVDVKYDVEAVIRFATSEFDVVA
jgi:hypothetical protein